MIAAIAIVAQASAVFSPPLDKPVLVTGEITRTDNGVTRRFVSTRRVTFRRADGGYRADVVIEPGEAPPVDDDPAAMFAAGIARMTGRPVALHLDHAGRVTRIGDQAAAWQAMLDGISALAPSGGGELERKRAARIRAVVAVLAQMPDDRQLATLGSLVASLVAAEVAAEGESAVRPVRVPASTAFGVAQLDGVRAVRMAGKHVEVTVNAAGALSIHGPDGPASARMTMETVRHVDPATGMLVYSRETVRTLRADGSVAAHRVTTLRLDM